MNEIYHKRATEYAKAIENNVFNALYDRPSLLSLIDSTQIESCLDLGCGPGAYISSLQSFCKNITAIDQSPEFVQIVKSRFSNVTTYECNFENGLGDEKSNSFDLVISALTIHYVEKLEELFKEIHRVLKNKGTFVFSTHHPMLDFESSNSKNYFQREKLTQLWNTLGDETEVTFFRRPFSEIMNCLFRAGFVVTGFSEGNPSEEIKVKSEKLYLHLTTKPQFVFIKATKSI